MYLAVIVENQKIEKTSVFFFTSLFLFFLFIYFLFGTLGEPGRTSEITETENHHFILLNCIFWIINFRRGLK